MYRLPVYTWKMLVFHMIVSWFQWPWSLQWHPNHRYSTKFQYYERDKTIYKQVYNTFTERHLPCWGKAIVFVYTTCARDKDKYLVMSVHLSPRNGGFKTSTFNPSKMVKKNVFLHTTYPALQILCFISHTYKPQILTPHMFIHIKSDAWCMLRGDILKLRRDFGSN